MDEHDEPQKIQDPPINNITQWLNENEQFFKPPVCNKMMHRDGQLKVFFVGGPNVRKDYHIEEGEEFFYMIKGDMCLKVVEQGRHKDITIKEGQVFLLPRGIPHSPQRQANTVGMVIERERDPQESDGLRYFVENGDEKTADILYERWFHCDDLGPQLSAIITEYFQTEQYKTGKVIPGTITATPPVTVDTHVKLDEPYSLKTWIKENKSKLDSGQVSLFDGDHQFQIHMYGEGQHTEQQDVCEVFIWQLEGTSRVTLSGNNRLFMLKEGDTLMVPVATRYTSVRMPGSVTMVVAQHQSFTPPS